ncbi:hypothetical protein QWZ08_18350 [Ferruginibacter paludis]|uniref:hypothetical protein n=1 Tax=Ferruginibacter paludis TaxID=1310417 RepID=UPI0025B4C999|nr:hypothetical protein [Ferruginibacter paludis]MDN3657620.1 hypothetical protein [Ferruginibacter paludis]
MQESGYDYLTTYSIERATPDILILGSSRAVNIFNTGIVETQTGLSCYNAGRYGEPVFYHYAVLQAALKRYTPKMVILSFDAGNFNKGLEAYDRIAVLLPYYENHPEIRPIIALKSRYENIKLLSKIYPYNSLLLPIITGNSRYSKTKYITQKGFIPIGKIFSGALQTYDYTKETSLDSTKIDIYRSFIKDCVAAHVQLHIVCPPYMIHAIGTDPSITEAKKIAAQYHVEFLDYSNDTAYTAHPLLFADYRHLNSTGVEVFTRSVIAKIHN